MKVEKNLVLGNKNNTNNKNLFKYLLDLAMLIIFMLLYDKMAINMFFHKAAGLVLGVAGIIHLVLNHKFILCTGKKVFSKELTTRARFNYIIDFLLLIFFVLTLVAGILIPNEIFKNTFSVNPMFWRQLHISAAFVTLILLGVHIGLHWTWVINTTKKLLKINVLNKYSQYLSKLMVVLILVFGVYNINVNKVLPKTFAIFNLSSYSNEMHNQTNKGPMGFGKRNTIREGSEKRNFIKGNDKVRGGGKQRGAGMKQHGGNTSIFSTLTTYLSITSVFIIITYYLEKLIKKLQIAK